MPCRSVSAGITRAKKMEWLSYKQYVDSRGKDEADAFIQAGTVMVRSHPRDPRYFQFCNESESFSMTFDKRKELCAQQQKALKTKEFKQLQTAISKGHSCDLDAAGADFSEGEKDPDDPAVTDDEEGLPKNLLALMGKGVKANSAKGLKPPADDKAFKALAAAADAGHQKNLESVSSAAGDTKEAIMKKANKMHSMLLSIAPKAPAPLKKDIQKKANELSKMIMDDKSAGMKSLLVQSVSIFKKAVVASKAKAK